MGSHSRVNQMIARQGKVSTMVLAISLALFVSGCKKKTPAPPPPPAPAPVQRQAPAAPSIVSFEAEPSTIERGGDSTLKWSVTGDATTITIAPGIGTVAASGTRRIFPGQTTVYTLTAGGPGGTNTANATVTVNAPAPPPPPAPPAAPTVSFAEFLEKQVQDAMFDYDKSDIREDARNVLTRNADALKSGLAKYAGQVVLIEGHCDERGSAEYNLGLGDRRAAAAKEFLVQLGVQADRLKTVSYGKEKPQCTEANESCWQRNRRAHFAPGN